MVLKRLAHIILKKKKLAGNTLIEVLMSLSILSLVFLLGMGLMQQVMGIYSPVQRFRTRTILHQEMEKTNFTFIPFEEEIEILGRRLHRQITWKNPQQQLVEVKLSCFWGEQEIESRYKIINLKNQPSFP